MLSFLQKFIIVIYYYRLENTSILWMLLNEKSNGTFRLQNYTVFELQSIQFSTTFKHELRGKVNTQTCVSTKPPGNYNKEVVKHLKIFFKYFGN